MTNIENSHQRRAAAKLYSPERVFVRCQVGRGTEAEAAPELSSALQPSCKAAVVIASHSNSTRGARPEAPRNACCRHAPTKPFRELSSLPRERSRCAVAPPIARRRAHHAAKLAAEVSLFGKAAVHCNLAERCVASQHLLHRHRDSALHEIRMGRSSKRPFECGAKIGRA